MRITSINKVNNKTIKLSQTMRQAVRSMKESLRSSQSPQLSLV